MKQLIALVLLAALAACSKSTEGPSKPAPQASSTPAAAAPADALTTLRGAITALQAKPEHTDAEVTVQHCLVGVKNPRMPQVTRTQAEAEAIAAALYARILAGEDFDAIVKSDTDDSHPGIYTMRLTGSSRPPAYFFRGDMADAFGDTGWRLAVGEVGVAPFDPQASPFGYHIIKRTR